MRVFCLMAAKKALAPALVILFLLMSRWVSEWSWFNIQSMMTRAPWLVILLRRRFKFTIKFLSFKNEHSSTTCLSVSYWSSIEMIRGIAMRQHLIAAVRYLFTWAPSANATYSEIGFFSIWDSYCVTAEIGLILGFSGVKNLGLSYSWICLFRVHSRLTYLPSSKSNLLSSNSTEHNIMLSSWMTLFNDCKLSLPKDLQFMMAKWANLLFWTKEVANLPIPSSEIKLLPLRIKDLKLGSCYK